MATDLSSDIASNAVSPQSASSDGLTVTAPSVAQQILADQYLAAKAAAGAVNCGIRFRSVRRGGQVNGFADAGGFDRLC